MLLINHLAAFVGAVREPPHNEQEHTMGFNAKVITWQ